MDKLCVHSRLRECKCRPNSTAQKKKIHDDAIMIRYTQKNVHSLFNGEDDVDEDGKRKKRERESAWTSSAFFISSILCVKLKVS